MTDDQLMSVRELAEYLNVATGTLYLWSKRGQLPAIKLGKTWRYRRSDIEAWLNQQRSPVVVREVQHR